MEGIRIDPYRVLGDLGSGGMGKVYLAEVEGKAPGLDGGTRVALKVIHPHLLETPGFFKRFLREAEIGRSVEQGNVVRCFDCDSLVTEGTRHDFLVMEYVEGQTLRGLLNELERVPEELCRHIGREIAKGLVAIHEAGVIHRDLKPENVLITEDHVVKVMDLGVARLQDEVIRLSQTGAFVGSLEYACPEQFSKRGEGVDARSDLYALGVMLYELSTGQHPYRTDDTSTTLRNVIEGKPRRAGEVNPQLSPFFEEVVHALAANEPGDRLASASLLLAVLEEGEKSDWWKDRAKALRIQTKRPLRRIRIPRETALYGRDEDLDKLHALYETAKAGDGRVLLIEGEAGIGKTRLVDEFVGRLRQEGKDINFLFGSYPPGGAATAAGAFSTAYREHFGEEGLEETLKEYVKPTPILIPAFAALLRGETTPTGAEPLTKDSLQTVFVHATRGLAAERTTIVLIDDLHFAPEDGRALFTSLALAVPEHRILLIGTMRPGVPEEWTAGITRLEQAEQRSLSRLGPKDLSKLLIDAFRSERLATELGLQIAQKSDGNPFFAFEIIRGLREGQFISQQPDGTWVTTKVIQDIQVPSSVLDLVNARVADLTQQERDLLDVASCCGFEFDPGLVATVVGEAVLPTLKRFAGIEKRHRLVRAAGRHLVFDHHQVQEALYSSLYEQMREAYHAAIGEALEASAGATDKDPKDLNGSLCVDVCEHFLKGAQGGKALRYLDAALSYLASGFLSDQTVVLADRALDVPGLLVGTERMDILLRKSRPLFLLGHRATQERVLDEAHALAQAAAIPASMARVELAKGLLAQRTSRLSEAHDRGVRSLALFREVGRRRGEADAHGVLGHALGALGRGAEAAQHHEKQVAIALDIGDRTRLADATQNKGISLLRMGFLREAQLEFERSLAFATCERQPLLESQIRSNLGVVLFRLGRLDEAIENYRHFLASSREFGNRQGEAVAATNLAAVLSSRGRFSEALAWTDAALAISREIRARQLERTLLSNLADILLWAGELAEAHKRAAEALAIAREIGVPGDEGNALLRMSQVEDQRGDISAARKHAAESLAVLRAADNPLSIGCSLAQLGGLGLEVSTLDAAAGALQEAVALLRDESGCEDLVLALALLASLPEGDVEAAEAALQEAGEAGNTPQTRYYLWKATGKREHLQEAKRLLDYRVVHAPEKYRESMLKNVRLNREIMEAWEEHGGGTEAEADE